MFKSDIFYETQSYMLDFADAGENIWQTPSDNDRPVDAYVHCTFEMRRISAEVQYTAGPLEG